MKTLTTITLVIGFAASLLSHAGESPGPSLDRAKREAIIAAANQAVQKHMKGDQQERKGTEISKELWGEAIAHLKPLRVRDDRVNVFIVLKEDVNHLGVTSRYSSFSIPNRIWGARSKRGFHPAGPCGRLAK